MRIIGLNSKYNASYDEIYSGSVALIEDGKIELAIAEERVSRVKHDGGFKKALDYIYRERGISEKEVDYFYISFYANPLIPDEEMIRYHLNLLGIEDSPEKLVVVPSHHISHAYISYFLSPFNESVIMVADNEGSLIFSNKAKEKNIINNYCERNSYYWAKGNCVSFIERDFEKAGNVAFGKAYNKFNEYVGLGNYLSAGKTMGLSPYGSDTKKFDNVDLWGLDDDGKLYSTILETYDSFRDIDRFLDDNNILIDKSENSDRYNEKDYRELAYFIQEQLNKWSVKKMDTLIRKTGISKVCTSGGVALNGIMNKEIEEKLNVDVFAAPFPSDEGQALGNAIYGFIHQMDLCNNSTIPKYQFSNFTYLGKEYSSSEFDKVIDEISTMEDIEVISNQNIPEYTARLLQEENIIAWYQGKSEYGARALGNRSILASPSSEIIRDRVNVLKGRELFRPLAPSVIAEHADDYFKYKRSHLEPYMLRVTDVHEHQIDKIKGVVHVNNTSRIQTVTNENNEKYYKLIKEYYKLTGIPMVMNTSFNLAGEPIVETPMQAFDTFYRMELDALILGDYIIMRKNSRH